jgi:hypothetical protein
MALLAPTQHPTVSLTTAPTSSSSTITITTTYSRTQPPLSLHILTHHLHHAVRSAVSLLALRLYLLSNYTARLAWRRSRRYRNRVVRDFFLWILNPNALALLVFWPGWWVLGVLWALYRLLG